MDVNVKAQYIFSVEVVKAMKERYPNTKNYNMSIVMISSVAGIRPLPMAGFYSVSKTALIGLAKVLGSEWAPLGIRVNAICPGIIKTEFSQPFWHEDEAKNQEDPTTKRLLKTIPMRRFGESKEIAAVAAMLCSDDGSYITGEHLVASGGLARL
eukprot:TRINITY_DN4003_c0_g1_i1.p2 TRINITY_DN4003_c0_g1~~TRINITY_DN4003_c0_g1_i1.p2  ORF type:complete len:154 (-),score=29.32 TRINITY_DN4003_c0_g1_i1:130-591(-)